VAFHSFSRGGDNSKVEEGILQNQYAKQSCILLILFIFENKVARGKCN